MSVFVRAAIPGELGEDLRERGEAPVRERGRAEERRASSIIGVVFLAEGGSEDRQDYRGGGGGGVRRCVCACNLACSPYLANAAVTKAIQIKRKICLESSGLFCLLHLFCFLHNCVAHQKHQQLGNKAG